MKKLSLMSLVVLGALLLTNCKKEETKKENTGNNTISVAEKNTAIYGKITATWCGPCGAWGWDLNDEITNEIGDKAIPMGIYGSSTSNFTNATVNKWYTDFGGKGYPSFTCNGVNKTEYATSGGIYTGQSKTNVVNTVNDHNNSPVQINAGGNMSWDGEKLKVNAAVKSFKDLSGDYYIGAYIIEDKAKSTQASRNGVVDHHHVCRGTMSTDVYGVKYNGSLSSGSQSDVAPFEFTVPSTWVKENIYVALIIWKKENGKYTFVNASKVK